MLAQTMAIWMVYTTMFGDPRPSLDDNRFTDYEPCTNYLKVRYEPGTIEAFGLVCFPARIMTPPANTTG